MSPASTTKALQKYLPQYAEPEQALLDGLPGQWRNVLIIPAYRESASFLDLSAAARCQGNALLILVLNEPCSVLSKEADKQWLNDITDVLESASWQRDLLSLHGDVLLVNRTGASAIPDKQGVGLARKIAADIACQLIASGRITSPWIFSTDADTTLPENYFACQQRVEQHSTAITLPFEHIAPENNEPFWPHQYYDWHMRYYVAGLEFAGSHYAYHSIGSCLAMHHSAYAQARGFPKRSGGEDFYMLNKLAKLGDIQKPQSPILRIQSRFSNRVPFGTGPATLQIFEAGQAAFKSYNPKVFTVLKELIEHINSEGTNRLSTIAAEAAEAIGLREFQQQKQASSIQQTHQWFDAFRQLKCIHWLRDNHYPNQAPLLGEQKGSRTAGVRPYI